MSSWTGQGDDEAHTRKLSATGRNSVVDDHSEIVNKKKKSRKKKKPLARHDDVNPNG